MNSPQWVRFLNLCDKMPLNIAQMSYYKSCVIQRMIHYVKDLTLKCHCPTWYYSHRSILSRTMNTIVLTWIAFPLTPLFQKNLPTDTIVPEGSSHIHRFNYIKLYPLIVYNRIIKYILLFPKSPKFPFLDHHIYS